MAKTIGYDVEEAVDDEMEYVDAAVLVDHHCPPPLGECSMLDKYSSHT